MNLLTEREYNDEIRSICTSAYEEYEAAHEEKSKPADPSEWVYEWLHETIDGHQYVIYTYLNTQVLTHSSNENAYWDQFDETPQASCYSQLMATLAFCAMQADVMALIDMSKFESEEACALAAEEV